MLPSELPPSPPPSRPSSPLLATGSKRKASTAHDLDQSKRPRATSIPDRGQQHQVSVSQAPQQHTRGLTEDGEVREESTTASSSRTPIIPLISTSPAVPVRRPKRGRPKASDYDALFDKYYAAGRQLKYSGDTRWWSTYSPGNREYKPLLNPPPVTSSYHQHGIMIARLELVDALVCFCYALWTKDYSRRRCQQENWTTTQVFLEWCKGKWQPRENCTNEAEMAFLGLM
jgi:hypothetical protein